MGTRRDTETTLLLDGCGRSVVVPWRITGSPQPSPAALPIATFSALSDAHEFVERLEREDLGVTGTVIIARDVRWVETLAGTPGRYHRAPHEHLLSLLAGGLLGTIMAVAWMWSGGLAVLAAIVGAIVGSLVAALRAALGARSADWEHALAADVTDAYVPACHDQRCRDVADAVRAEMRGTAPEARRRT